MEMTAEQWRWYMAGAVVGIAALVLLQAIFPPPTPATVTRYVYIPVSEEQMKRATVVE